MAAIIECRSLTKSFGSLHAIQALDLDIEAGASVGLVGPNGAGKTTLFSLFCGFLRPDHGTVRILGHHTHAAALKGRIGILPQDIPLGRGIAVKEQLLLFARLQGFRKAAARDEVERVLSLAQVKDQSRQFPETLSYGQRKKVTLAQALLGEPDIILLDEPTSGLDPVAASHVRSVIQKIRESHTCIVSSHNLEEIKSVCDQIVVIDRGSLVEHCRIDDLLGQNNSLSVLLEEEPPAALLQLLEADADIVHIAQEAPGNRRLTITFQHESPRQFQQQLLARLEKHGVSVVEFSRGSAFTDKVIQLVSGRQSDATPSN